MIDDSNLLGELAKLPTGNYTDKDRYRDFRKVFTSDEGKRVLGQIVSWAKVLTPSVMGSPIDPYKMAVCEGEKNLARRILLAVYNEPPEPQTQTVKQATRKRSSP
jgi:hypothetical protein